MVSEAGAVAQAERQRREMASAVRRPIKVRPLCLCWPSFQWLAWRISMRENLGHIMLRRSRRFRRLPSMPPRALPCPISQWTVS